MKKELVQKYLRAEKLPHIWCAGCGNGIVLSALVEAIDKSNLDKDKICIVSGIGCSSRAAQYMNFDTVHTLHGRALAFATGVKLANPDLHVIVLSGDGDCSAIGGNHLIHACRRNMDMTLLVFNNNIYGMTGGQASPTTPMNAKTTTTTKGNLIKDFDICKLTDAAGATHVSRGSISSYNNLVKSIGNALEHKGFSVVEALTTCPVQFGRRNKMGEAAQMIEHLKNTTSLRDEEGKLKLGTIKETNEPEYIEEYMKIVK